jgi:hypothetical protein
MVMFLFLVSLIVLIDFSGFGITDELVDLLYVSEVVEKESQDVLGDVSGMSSDELAVKVEEKIFDEK